MAVVADIVVGDMHRPEAAGAGDRHQQEVEVGADMHRPAEVGADKHPVADMADTLLVVVPLLFVLGIHLWIWQLKLELLS